MREIENLLIEKNRKYGNSATAPANIFSKNASPIDQIEIQIDHKLARISRGDPQSEDEDVLIDLIGYLVLLIIAKKGDEQWIPPKN